MAHSLDRRLFLLLVVILVWSGAMLFEAKGISDPNFRAPSGCYFTRKPIVDVELAQTTACFRSIAMQGANVGHNRNICLYRVNTYMDFLFIFLYWLVFLTFAQIEKGPFAKLASAAITIAAVADIWENLRIFGALNAVAATQPPDFLLPRNVSLVKWAFLGIVFILLAVAVWLSKGRWYVLVAAALFVSGLAVLAGLRYPAAMQAAGLGFLLVFILLLCRVWPHRRNALSERG